MPPPPPKHTTHTKHKSRGCVRKPNTPPTKPDLQDHKQKKSGGGADPNKQDQHPHHQKRRPGNTNPQTGQHSPVHSLKETVGSALLSHNPPVAVPSAQKGLTSRFGKDTGCNPLAKTTNTTNKQHPTGRNPPVSETNIHMYQPNPQTPKTREPIRPCWP